MNENLETSKGLDQNAINALEREAYSLLQQGFNVEQVKQMLIKRGANDYLVDCAATDLLKELRDVNQDNSYRTLVKIGYTLSALVFGAILLYNLYAIIHNVYYFGWGKAVPAFLIVLAVCVFVFIIKFVQKG